MGESLGDLASMLVEIADRKPFREEDDCIFDCSGGNLDDAYSGGVDDGESMLAETILKWLEENHYPSRKGVSR